MAKRKKKFKKKINPEKSNKMIIAVGVGVVIVFSVIFFLMMGPQTPGNKAKTMENTLKYLKKTTGIMAIKTFPEQNRALIVYDSAETKPDFVTIARYAALKLSYKIGNEEIIVELSKDREEQAVYTAVAKNGEVIREGENQ